MYDGTGISAAGNLIDHGIRFGLVEKSGSWFSLSTGDRLGQGRAARATLNQNPEMAARLDQDWRCDGAPPQRTLPSSSLGERLGNC